MVCRRGAHYAVAAPSASRLRLPQPVPLLPGPRAAAGGSGVTRGPVRCPMMTNDDFLTTILMTSPRFLSHTLQFSWSAASRIFFYC